MDLSDPPSEEWKFLEAFERTQSLIAPLQQSVQHPIFILYPELKIRATKIEEEIVAWGKVILQFQKHAEAERAQKLTQVELFPMPISFVFDRPFPENRPYIIWNFCTRKFAPSGIGSPTESLLALAKEEIIAATQYDISRKLQSHYGNPLTWLRLKHITYCQWQWTEGIEGVEGRRDASLTLEYKVY